MKTHLILLAALSLAACSPETEPGIDTEAGTPPALLPSDTAAEVLAPVDNATSPGVPDLDTVPVGPQGRTDVPQAASPAGAPPQERAAAPTITAHAIAASDARSQSDAAAILRRASAAYEDINSLRADFVMRRDVPLLKQTITSRGTLYQRSPDRIALRFTDPAGDLILSDGEHFWVYYPSTDPAQVMQFPAAQGGSSGVDLKAQFVGNPVERFHATLHGTETVAGRTANVLTLVPRQRAEYRSLKVWLDARDSLARRFEITELNGSTRRFELDAVRTNVTIPDATFRFAPPAGVRIIRAG